MKDKSPVLCNEPMTYPISVLEHCRISSVLNMRKADAGALTQKPDSILRQDNRFSSLQESRTILYIHQFPCTYLNFIFALTLTTGWTKSKVATVCTTDCAASCLHG
jgi:hypothetical protein